MAAAVVQRVKRQRDTVAGQHVTVVGFDHGRGFVCGVSQVGNRSKGIFAIVRGAWVQQHITAREARFHFNDFFALDIQLGRHRIDLAVIECVTVRVQVCCGVFTAVTLFHRPQVEKQLALRLGGGHFHHAPVFQDVFMNFGFDPMHGVTHQAHALVRIEPFDRLHQADIAFLNQVAMWQAVTQVFA